MKGIRLIGILIFVVFSFVQASYGEEEITVAGSGGMIPLMNELSSGYMKIKKDVSVKVNQKSIQSAGGITSAAEGKIDIGMANRNFKEGEKELGLQQIVIARVGVVVGANYNAKIKEISSENLCKIYKGEITNWKALGGSDKDIMAITKSENDSTKEVVRKKIACFSDIKEPETIILVPTSPDTAKILSNKPNAIGFTDLIAVANSGGLIIPLSIDGVEPNIQNIRSGKYVIVQNYSLVVKQTPSKKVKDFIDFIKGSEGTKIIESNNAIAIK